MTHRSNLAQTLGLAGWLAVVFVAGGVGAFASIEAASFYAQLARPAWAPPAAVFGPVWSLLYALMGIAAWFAWRESGSKLVASALALFVAQLCANALWSWLFFRWHMGTAAFVDVLILLVLIAATIAAFWRVRRLAGVLLVPYFLWVCFACALTWSIWQRNPALLR